MSLEESEMHKSKLSTFVIDCQTSDLDAAAEFWSRALGRRASKLDPDEAGYRMLSARRDEPMLLVQQVTHPSRIHLDIEADDLEAEARRLEALGAKRIEFVKRWWVMEAPTGQRFCIVNPQRGPIGADGNEWPEAP
jgi:predicted enzyme related to lactoylglutathione lyase